MSGSGETMRACHGTAGGARPLAGLRVLDFGHTIMGPCAGLVLADLGADVVKVEPIDGDSTRRLPGFASGFYAAYNRNKRSIALDLKAADGQAVLRRLAAGADVLVENYGPGTMERLGCGYADLAPVSPRLIYLALKGFLSGPYEARGALDEVVQMQSGLAYMTGPPGRPLRAGASIIDILGAVFGIVAVLAALEERGRTGRGQRVGSSLFESAAFLMAPHMAGSAASGEPMRPFPARRSAWGIYDVFPTGDGRQVFIGVTSDAHWRRFCEAFLLAELAVDPRLGTNALRCDAREWMMPRLERTIGALSADDILARCEAAALPFAPVGHPDDLAHDPHLLGAGGLLSVALGAFGGGAEVPLPGTPLEFGPDRQKPAVSRQPPAIGQQTAEILAEAGLGSAEIADLLTRRIVVASVAEPSG